MDEQHGKRPENYKPPSMGKKKILLHLNIGVWGFVGCVWLMFQLWGKGWVWGAPFVFPYVFAGLAYEAFRALHRLR